ncbi:zinc finger, CCHC-type containing protein [Tanacetum coccineum]
MGDANPIRTLGDYSKPSHEGYRNTIELNEGNNVVPLRSATIRLVQNGCSFHGLRSEDPNQHLKEFFKLVDSLDLNGENRERTRLRRTSKLRNDILMFQQHQRESLSEAWTRFKDLFQKVPHHGIDRWLLIQKFYDHVSFHLKCEIDRVAGGKLRDKNADESWEIIENLALYDHERWNDSKDFVKPVKAISTPQSTSKTPDRRLLELEDQVNFLLKRSRPTPKPSSTQVPQAYAEAVYSNPRLQNQNEQLMQNPFTFYERTGLNPHPQALETTFKARVRDYMATHAERMERFRYLQTSHPITKNVNSISIIREEEEKDVVNNKAIIESIVEPSKSEEEKPPKKASLMNEVERRAEDEPTKSVRENVTKNEEEEAA